MLAAAAADELVALSSFYGALAGREYWGDHICCAAQPEEANGSPEDLVLAGVDEGAAITGQWAEQIVDAVTDRSSVNSLLSALGTLEERLDRTPLARAIERRLMHGIMLGALDSEWEREHEEEVRPATFAATPGTQEGAFSSLPYADAVRLFNERKVLPKAAFDALEQGARRTAFTVARMASSEMLNVTKAELARMLHRGRQHGEGADLRDFRRFAKERLERAGWTPANKSHVETIYRTNILTGVASGGFVEKIKPEVRAALPYWQIRGVRDSRARKTHVAAFGVVLRADHPFWRTAYPPFGYNCRCRVVARSERWLQANGGKLGPVPRDLPDPGFDSGTDRLISVPAAALGRVTEPTVAPTPTAPSVSRGPGGFPVDPGPPLPPPLPAPLPLPAPPPAPAPRPKPTRHRPPRVLDRYEAERMQDEFAAAGVDLDSDPNALRKVQYALFGETLDAARTKALTGLEGKTNLELRYATGVSRDGDLQIFADGFAPSGEQVLRMVRGVGRGPNGELVAHNALFTMKEGAKGQGVGKSVLADQVRRYRELGIKRIEVEAAWDGQYVWPRMGFRLQRPGELKRYQAQFATWLEDEGFAPEIAEQVAKRSGSLTELALTRHNGIEVGKRFLLHRGNNKGPLIDLELPLDDGDPTYEAAARYLGIK